MAARTEVPNGPGISAGSDPASSAQCRRSSNGMPVGSKSGNRHLQPFPLRGDLSLPLTASSRLKETGAISGREEK